MNHPLLINFKTPKIANYLRYFLIDTLNGRKHWQALLFYFFVVIGHFSEHLIQIGQVYLLGWSTRKAGGILGLWFPGLAASEVLHMAYNSLQLTGLILLWYGFRRYKHVAKWWNIAIIAQSWHFLEHTILQVQYLTGSYLFGASRQTSLLEFFFPRIELHFAYNLLAFTPTAIALCLYFIAMEKRRTAKPTNKFLRFALSVLPRALGFGTILMALAFTVASVSRFI